MIDPVVPIAVRDESVITPETVRIDGTALRDALVNNRPDRDLRDIGDGGRIHSATALENAENSHFSCCATATVPLPPATEVALIDLMDTPDPEEPRLHRRRQYTSG